MACGPGMHLSSREVLRVIEALLCDIDGTLVQSNWLHASAWKDAFAAMGIDVEQEEVRRQIGKGGDELIPVFVSWWRRSAVEEPLKAYRKFLFRTDYLPQVKPLPHARDFLVRIKQAGIRLALASSSDKQDLETYKKLVGMEDLVDKSTSADDAKEAKPHPDIFEVAMGKLGLPPEKVLALGDTPYDAEAAGKAGVWTIGVESGGWTRDDLLEAGCIEVWKDVAELWKHFDESVLMRWQS